MGIRYEAPHVVDIGSVKELTLGHAAGSKLDHSFPSGTPVSALTFMS